MDIQHILREIICLFTIFSLGLSCNTDWSEMNGKCYRPFPFEYDFRMARRVCQIYKGDLAFINNNTLIISISVHPDYDRTKHYWVKEGSYHGNGSSTPLTTVSPPTALSNGCPYLNSAASKQHLLISPEDCDKNNPFICEVQKKGADLICPQTWDLYGSYCFKRSIVQATYADAAGICSLQRGRLAILDNEDKVHYGLAIVLGWNIAYTVGASKTNGSFKWSNGNDFQSNCSECIKGESDMECMGLLSETFHPTLYSWIKSNCSETHNFLCEMDAVKVTTPAPVQTTTALKPLGCPYGNNWKRHGEYCYW
ncbi:uncharacterized protein LOC118192541, partial [Stegodyphus dumicola]|uniref:uncharacterized protein LOC118192541 n=1 Tax=Stegodyphus dumicola TaxID=202533 RepID=UPI0015B0D1D3